MRPSSRDHPQGVLLAEHAAELGAVLAIVQREGGDKPVAAAEPALEAAGYHKPRRVLSGTPVTPRGSTF
jgi:hypothetical protein